jgi:phosphoribosylformimino-5-aminoimidazole carboxamide ribotide isomerase
LLHVVDLDGAFAKEPKNREAIAAIVQSVNVPVQLGGGVRTVETLSAYLELGVERVVIGTAAHSNPKLLVQACERFPGKVVLGIDSRKGRVAGPWQLSSTLISRGTACRPVQTSKQPGSWPGQ